MKYQVATHQSGSEQGKVVKGVVIYSLITWAIVIAQFFIVKAIVVHVHAKNPYMAQVSDAFPSSIMIGVFILFVSYKLHKWFVKTFIYGEAENPRYIVRKVVTNIGKEYYSVYKELYEGRFKHNAFLMQKYINSSTKKYLFEIGKDEQELEFFIDELIRTDKQAEIDNQTICSYYCDKTTATI